MKTKNIEVRPLTVISYEEFKERFKPWGFDPGETHIEGWDNEKNKFFPTNLVGINYEAFENLNILWSVVDRNKDLYLLEGIVPEAIAYMLCIIPYSFSQEIIVEL